MWWVYTCEDLKGTELVIFCEEGTLVVILKGRKRIQVVVVASGINFVDEVDDRMWMASVEDGSRIRCFGSG